MAHASRLLKPVRPTGVKEKTRTTLPGRLRARRRAACPRSPGVPRPLVPALAGSPSPGVPFPGPSSRGSLGPARSRRDSPSRSTLSVLMADATGVGAGLASFLADQFRRGPRRVIVSPFLFNRKTTSNLGWAFIDLIDGGRIKEYADDTGWAVVGPTSPGSTVTNSRPAPTRSSQDRGSCCGGACRPAGGTMTCSSAWY